MSWEPSCKTHNPDHFVPYPMAFAPPPPPAVSQLESCELHQCISDVNNQLGSRNFLVLEESYEWLGGVVPHHNSRTEIMRMKLCDRKGFIYIADEV